MADIDALNLLDDLLKRARAAGADTADAIFVSGRSMSVSQRLGKPEAVERSEGTDLGLRVMVGARQAMVSSSDFSEAALAPLAERAVAMARIAPEDPYAGLADPSQILQNFPTLDLLDESEPAADKLVEQARIAEEAARAVAGVTNSDGGNAGWGRTDIAFAATNGFSGAYARSSHSISAIMLAGEGQNMQRDYDYDSKVYGADLADPADIGRIAGERAVARLNPRRLESQKVPVVYDPRAGRSLLGHLSGALNGSSVARGTSFLKDAMGEMVFSDAITVVDDPHRARGFRSKPFDGEGLANMRRQIIDNGRLTSWFLDLATARQLGLESTGHAARGTGGPPSPSASNLYIEAGDVSVEELIADIKSGIYVDELMGSSVSPTTGDYSRGASGFWIEDGKLTYPVTEATIAGNLKEMFKNISAANDLVFRYGTDVPTLRIEGMTLAGGG